MSKTTILKGSIFEWFVRQILKSCGFIKVQPDNVIVYNGPPGLMIHGIGQAHNADVLMYPPLQIPLYFPSRLLVECKAYGKDIGLPIIRGVFGLREDINNFEIVTPNILQQRRNYRRRVPAFYPYERYQYQVALATLLGIKYTALEFAITHKIPILSFYGSLRYKFLRNFINSINDDFCKNLCENYILLKSYFTEKDNHGENIDDIEENLTNFINQSSELFQHMYIGVTENGNILFLYSQKVEFTPAKTELLSTIHWRSNQNEWWITTEEGNEETNENSFYFELPQQISEDWARKEFDKRAALNIKEKNFSRIYVFKIINGKLTFFILKLNMEFIRMHQRELENDL